jgi:hypothetical protein
MIGTALDLKGSIGKLHCRAENFDYSSNGSVDVLRVMVGLAGWRCRDSRGSFGVRF